MPPTVPPRPTAPLERLKRLHPRVIDLSLDRLRRLLDRLDNPERRLAPVLHVAGTNGKGSTVATLRAIAEAAGHRVHVYTSPHLVRFNERIRLSGTLIDDAHLNDLIDEVETVNNGAEITFFEVTTAVAMLAFARVPADLTILEVGLGGRLDATNVVDRPAACCITPVSFDHQDYLGTTIEAIAAEKAGILKKGVPAVIGPQLEAARATIAATAREVGAPLHVYGEDWHCAPVEGDGFRFDDRDGHLSLPAPTVQGLHQIANAGMAVATLRAQSAVPVSEAAIRAGLGWVRWPARLQPIENTPLNRHLPEQARLWLDGGHNPAAATVIRAFLQGFDPVEEPVTLIVGMMQGKDLAGFLGPLIPQAARAIAVPIPGQEKSCPPGDVAAAISDAGLQGSMARDVISALEIIRSEAKPDTRPVVLIIGSLYLAGRVLEDAGLLPE
ncbi:bifunctional folylpolyglutamate synthase/dihydrofolate synthase [Eilatimonas milleporae]|uniref:Dihydrofolate synthase/folylpolyglutamate synthase n=1 Tax=Eilatimonas milleporae TaxID=911205 RepID=A0A3M0BYV0_9PROT|nr:folylpolyglutamate synthase/dihydrofolate synthase family protein [Eilatimonas milleporae]RMB02784.1 dihydrofolate synthase/folylpolyglutamate synthase [Eilatimonas milleporae]